MDKAPEKFQVRLTDGTIREVDATTYRAVGILAGAVDACAKGITSGFALVEISYRGNVRDTVLTLNGEHLDKLAGGVAQQQTAIQNLASLWEGNAPPNSRSLTRQ